MSESELSEAVALRIGLAARALPDTDPARLFRVLGDAVGLPPTIDKLAALTLKQLLKAADGDLAEIDKGYLRSALDALQGKEDGDALPLPDVEAYSDGDMDESIRVAIASNGGEMLDGHFGSCRQFLIYQLSGSEVRLIDIRGAALPESADEDKNTLRAAQLADCQILYVVSVGGPAAAKVIKRGIHPVKQPQGGDAREILTALQQRLATTPPPWLAKLIGVAAEQRVRFEREAS